MIGRSSKPSPALVDHVRARACEYFPCVWTETPAARLVWSMTSDNAAIHRLALGAPETLREVVLKVRRPREKPRDGDEELIPPVDDQHKLAYECAALVAIEGHFGRLGDGRLGAVRVLDQMPEQRAFLMEAAPAENLGSALQRELGQGSAIPPHRLEALRNSGAWLRAFHRLSPLPQTRETSGGRESFLRSVLELAEGVALDPRARLDVGSFTEILAEAAHDALPEEPPIAGIGHGDYRPGNVLADAAGRVYGIDTFGSWRGPIYFDLGHFLYQLKLPSSWLARRPASARRAALQRAEREFLGGYFGSEPVPVGAVRLYELQALLYRWSRAARAARWPGRSGLAKRARLFVKTAVFQDLLQGILRDLDPVGSASGGVQDVTAGGIG